MEKETNETMLHIITTLFASEILREVVLYEVQLFSKIATP